ncbi:LysM peptidoglycan-binding domain-containing protein [Mesobacillus foraminis]|uniref:LysM domain-containing protein n=1 Tax=Mesobacillus foraminis TaxID=279826 RepID=A0A4V6NKN8_9BACI|nr:LysM peptidoglycan-binding domain-containing protein [Mesobacillus foraminis]TCN23010.1 LysM domain-containing protein [Mesobacillus foraminis]
MNKEDPYRDQAERLRKKIERNKSTAPVSGDEIPPRSRVHSQKRNKNKIKLKYPVIRMLVLFFILLPITVFSAYNYLNGKVGTMGKNPVETGGYETISVEKEKDVSGEKDIQDEFLPVKIEEKEPGTKEEPVSVDPAPLPKESVVTGSESKDAPAASTDQEEQTPTIKASKRQEVVSVPEPAPQKSEPPSQNEQGGVSPKPEPENTQKEKVIYHTVQSGETLFRVAMKYYQSQAGIEIIRKANNLQGNEIQLGQVLKIPLKE